MTGSRIEKVDRELIENKMLAALDDSEVVAILATKDDLDLLIRSVDAYASITTRGRDLADDLKKLRQAAFSGN